MGNYICHSVQNQGQYSRDRLNLCNTTIQTIPQPLRKSFSNSIKNQESNELNEGVQIVFKGHFIKCRPQAVRYLRSQNSEGKIPIINGHVRLYKNEAFVELVYEGEMRKSKLDGFGKLYKQDQVIYEGQFKNNLFDGWGISPQYSGEFRQGKYDGYGIYKQFGNQDKDNLTFYFQGYFQNGLYSGSGVLIKGLDWPATKIQRVHNQQGIFEFINQQIQHGFDLITKYGAKQIYIGQFSNGYRHGFGRLFTEKQQFSGQFSHNLYHGLGTIYNNTSDGKVVTQTVFKMGKQFKL